MISILFVEDNLLLCNIIKESLTYTDIKIKIVNSGKDALLFLKSGEFDAIISEYNMPEMNGITLLQKVRKEYGDIPFILYSAQIGEEVIIDALNSGADFYFRKEGYPRNEFNILINNVRDVVERRNREMKTRDRVLLFNEIFSKNEAIMLLISLDDGRINDANEAATNFYSLSRDELKGMTIFQINPETKDQITNYMQKTLENGKNRDIFEHHLPNGIIKYVEVDSTPVRIESNIFIFSIIHDISYQKKAERARIESENQIKEINYRFTLAVDTAGIGVWDMNLVNNFVIWDDWMYQLYRFHKSDKMDLFQKLIEAIHPEDLKLFEKELRQAIDNKGKFDLEYRIFWPDGEIRYLKVSAKIISDSEGKPMRMIGICYDITEQKKNETSLLQYASKLESMNIELDILSYQLSQLNKDLDQKVQERTQEVNRLLVMKSELITQIGHDLKTPLTSVSALLPYIRKKIDDPNLIKMLDVVILDAHRMKDIISAILDLAGYEIRSYTEMSGEVNLKDVMDDAIKSEHLLINEKNLKIINSLPGNVTIKMAPAHMNAICQNLLSNAVKYSNPKGSISIYSNTIDQDCILTVEDEGIGLSEEEIPRIFDEFYRVDRSRHDRDSHGLGLAIINRITNAYGGKITVFSKGPGEGSRFEVRIPLNLSYEAEG